MIIFRMALLGFLLAVAQAAAASAVDKFSAFVSGSQSGKAAFDQKVYNRDNKLVQESRGSFAFSRPGRFRWAYEKPYSQLIVGDGSRVWIYDEDLKQVTVKKVDQAISSTPAALLSGNNEVLRSFKLAEQGEKDGLEWLEATPNSNEGGFNKIRIGFGASGPEEMVLSDSFGQRTVLRLTNLERNPRLDQNLFRFTPPKGADVIGDQK